MYIHELSGGNAVKCALQIKRIGIPSKSLWNLEIRIELKKEIKHASFKSKILIYTRFSKTYYYISIFMNIWKNLKRGNRTSMGDSKYPLGLNCSLSYQLSSNPFKTKFI